MSNNLFILDKTESVTQEKTDLQDSILHNESIAENFIKLMGKEGEKSESVATTQQGYDDTIDILNRASRAEKQAQQSTTQQDTMSFYRQVQDMVVGQMENAQMHNVQMENSQMGNIEEQVYDNYIAENQMDSLTDSYLAQEQMLDEQAMTAGATAVMDMSSVTNSDLLPTETTTQYTHALYQDELQEHVDSKKTAERSKKASILVAVGIAIMAIILALICINVGVINNLQSNLDSTYAKYNTLQVELKASQAQLEAQLKPENIIQAAKDKLNMIEK